MSYLALQVENLSKKYKLSLKRNRHDTLRDHLVQGFTALWQRNGNKGKALRSRRVSDHGGTFWALKDVSFDVKQGEVVGVIGRNGAGKSTLLKLLSRITEPTSGRAAIYGRVGSLLEVGTGFNSELSGRENTYLSGAILGMKKAELDRKFDEIVAFAELDDFIDTPVKRYSSGMYTRLAFAVAAHLNPEILLVDEVLAVGDAAFQRKCLGKMDEVSRQGRTVLFVTHNMAMIENLCTRALFFSQGRLIQNGPTNEVISHYLNEISTLSNIALDHRTDRMGEGEIRFTSVEFLDRDEKTTTCPVSGQELIIRLHYRGKSNKLFRNCRVSVSVHKDERAYFLMSTELVDNRQLDISGDGYIDFVIPELPLSAGEYYVNPFIETNRIKQDWVTRAATFSVIDGDFYGTGRNYPFGWQGKCVLVKYQWSVNIARRKESPLVGADAPVGHHY